MKLIIGITLFCLSLGVQAKRHGEIRIQDLEREVYLADASSWVSPEAFWDHYVSGNASKHWGSSETYPPYAEVNEFDTFVVELETGTCLMEFFHSRWRRANDVRRWDPQFNEHSACPDVFK